MSHARTAVRILAVAGLTAGLGLAGGGSASADDHLFNAAHSQGVDQRGFTSPNPVVGNPSGRSGAASQPGTVPGLGDPKTGADTGTPSFDCVSLQERLEDRSNGVGPSCP